MSLTEKVSLWTLFARTVAVKSRFPANNETAVPTPSGHGPCCKPCDANSSGNQASFPFPAAICDFNRLMLFCLSDVEFIAMIEVNAEFDDALSPVAMPVAGNLLASTFLVVVLSAELLLDDTNEGCLLVIGLNIVRFLGVTGRLLGVQSSVYAPISSQESSSESSSCFSTSYGTPAGFL